MRSSIRKLSKLKDFRLSGSGIVATFAAVAAVTGSVTLMNDVLVRWDMADTASKSAATSKATQLAKPETVRVLASVAKVKDAFSNVGYSLDAVRSGEISVPRVLHASLPHDLPQMQRAQDRKAVFLRYMLPYVLAANSRVLAQRKRLLTLRVKNKKGQRLGEEEAVWLGALFQEYQVKPGKFATLSLRVDTVPVSLALAQSAVESGWGTSRFAQEGNAPFGQWTSTDHEGLVPLERKKGLTHKVRAFESLAKSVDSYLRNLNTHRAYRGFRKARTYSRKTGKPIDSIELAETLTSYSEKGKEYVTLLQGIITKNDLRSLDDAQLGTSVVVFHPDAY
jgi:Bax protein